MLSIRLATRPLPVLHRSVGSRCVFSTSSSVWSGHNKWSKIRHNKGAQDAKKSALNGKAHRDIMVAVRGGSGADPESNATLAVVLKRVKAQGVPKSTIESALKKAAGNSGKGSQALTFEAMVDGTVGVLVECLTDNINRTLHSLRDIVSSRGARTAPVAFMFQRKGCVRVAIAQGDDVDARLERLIEAALEAEAEDFEQIDPDEPTDAIEVEFICPMSVLAKVTNAVTAPGLCKELISSELVYRPVDESENTPDDQVLEAVGKLVDHLEADEDVLRVWTTLD